MDKVKKFLEGYVQWLALAIGALFLGWTVWGNILNKPVTSTVESTEVEPSEVNHTVWETGADKLLSHMNDTSPLPNMKPTVNYPREILAEQSKIPAEVKPVYSSLWLPMPATTDYKLQVDTPGSQNPTSSRVATIPVIPAPVKLEISRGHSTLQPAANLVSEMDKNWITCSGIIPVDPLAKSLADANIPKPLNFTCLFRVEVLVQVKDAAGNWVDDAPLHPLDISPLMALPPVNCSPDDRAAYKTWAETPANVISIAEPPFYTVLQGAVWYEPGMVNPNERVEEKEPAPFDRKDPLSYKGDRASLLPDDLKVYDDAVKKKEQQDALRHNRPNNNNNGGTGTPPGTFQPPSPPGTSGTPRPGHTGTGTSGGGGRFAVPDPAGANPNNIFSPPQPAGPYPGAYPGGYPGANPGYPPRPVDSGGGQGSSVAALPQGSFDPAARAAAAVAAGTSPDIKIWMHDINVQPGKTYRYQIRYILSNPLAGTTNTCKDPADEQKAYIASPWSEWSKEINVESDSQFYAIDNKHGIHFDIFTWKKGGRQLESVYANAGDRIGSIDPTNHIDFDTGWTLVDVRDDPGGNNDNKILLLVSDNGTVKQKEISVDRQSREYRKLMAEWNAGKKDTASAGGPPTAPPVR